jgi:hypothetical protein
MGRWLDLEQEAKNGQWQRFLEPLVGRDRPVSVALLDEAIRQLTSREGDARNEIYAYLKAQQKVGAKRAFWIGEALRECGVAWSSGVIALATAGHLKELTALFAYLSLLGDDVEARAVHLAAACAVLSCEYQGDDELAMLQQKTREAFARHNLAMIDDVREAWAALSKRAGSYGRLFASVRIALADAYASACLQDHSSRGRRVFEDLRRWAISFAQRDPNPKFLAVVAPCFACRARLDHCQLDSYYLDALIEGARPDRTDLDKVLREKPRTLEEVAREAYGVVTLLEQKQLGGRRKPAKGKDKR